MDINSNYFLMVSLRAAFVAIVALIFIIFSMRKKIVELKETCNHLGNLAHIDVLTGLLNRRAFSKGFDRQVGLLRENESDNRNSNLNSSLELLFIDIDNFKSINDTYGHQVGDDVLKKVSDAIVSILRDTDLVCRWGGEEIVASLPNIKPYFAGSMAEKIRLRIENLDFEPLGLKVTVSIGVAYIKYKLPLEKIIEMADESLYKAKGSGKNKVCLCEYDDD